MDINTLTEDQYVDIFLDPGTQKAEPQLNGANFRGEDNNVNLFESTTDTTTLFPSTTDTTTVISTTETTTAPPVEDVDLTGETEEEKKAGRKPKYDFSDASGYFADRFKSGKLVAIKETAEDGTERDFIPKTPEEFDEVIDIQVNYKLDQERKELEEKWYQGKSPAWKAVAKYADMTDDPAEILPFLQGVKTIDSVANLDENEIDTAEQIIRVRLQQRGDSEDIIDSHIEALKTTDKLVETAKKYKPLILQQEKAQLAHLYQQKQQEETQRRELISSIEQNAIKVIETPLFGKTKLKQEEKAVIYDLIGIPDEESQGYKIYSEIDNLFESGDFETLRQVALLLKKKDAFLGYVSAQAADKTAAGLQRQLRAAVDSKTASSGASAEGSEDKVVVNRRQYTSAPKFGRG